MATTLPKLLLDLARDPNVAPEKFSALVAAHAEQAQRDAEAAFIDAFHKMAPDLPVIDEQNTITYRDGRTGTYAANEDIQTAIQPILWWHGFTLAFETSYPGVSIRVDGVLTHKKGHSRRSSFESGTDTSGGKTLAQGRGSIISYGHRYTTVDLLNLITRGADDDGQSSGKEAIRLSPEIMATWPDLCAASYLGMDTLDRYWATMTTEGRASISANDWAVLKNIALTTDTSNAAL